MRDKQLFRELITPKSPISSTRYGFITQLEIVEKIIYAGIIVETIIVAYGLYKGNLPELSTTIMTVAESFGILSAVISGFAFGGKGVSKFAETRPGVPVISTLTTDGMTEPRRETSPEKGERIDGKVIPVIPSGEHKDDEESAAAAENDRTFNEQRIK